VAGAREAGRAGGTGSVLASTQTTQVKGTGKGKGRGRDGDEGGVEGEGEGRRDRGSSRNMNLKVGRMQVRRRRDEKMRRREEGMRRERDRRDNTSSYMYVLCPSSHTHALPRGVPPPPSSPPCRHMQYSSPELQSLWGDIQNDKKGIHSQRCWMMLEPDAR
jgi:hypothetical protein